MPARANEDPSGARSVPAPLGEDRLAVGRGVQQLSVDLPRPVERRLPVDAQVLAALHAPIRLRGQLDPHVGSEAVDQTVQVGAVERVDETMDHR
jgi:hypothetical protein